MLTESADSVQNAVPVRIVHLVAALHSGGIERLLLAMAPYWDRKRFSVEVWCLNIESLQEYIDQLQHRGIPVRTLGRRERGKIEPGLLWRLVATIIRERICIIHSHTQYPLFLALLARIFLGSRVVHIHHQHSMPSNIQICLLKYLGRIRSPDQIIAVSVWMAETIRSVVPSLKSPLAVIHNGIEIPSLEHGAYDGRILHVYTAARLTAPKNVELLVHAMQKVLQIHPDATLTILGDGELLPNLKEASRRLGIGDRVTFHGYVFQPEKYYPELDLFVLPSLSEAFGLSLLEAMAWGKPCVATDVGGTLDFLQNNKNGLSVPSNDQNAMAEAIIRIMTEPSLAKRLGIEARKTAEQFSIEKTVKQIEELYAKQLNNSHCRTE
jgi:glycosyltransferase involved in cell wall biosynthesis